MVLRGKRSQEEDGKKATSVEEKIVHQDVELKEDGVLMYSAGTLSAVGRDLIRAVLMPAAVQLQLVLWRTSGPSLGGVGGMSGPQAPSNGA